MFLLQKTHPLNGQICEQKDDVVCFFSGSSGDAYWTLDLGQIRTIKKIVIITPQYTVRIEEASMRIGMNADVVQNKEVHIVTGSQSSSKYEVALPTPETGRYFGIVRYSSLEFCKVELYE